MNKLKSILCSMLLFVVCAVMCVGCNVEDDSDFINQPKTESIISLLTAEDVILDALKEDNIVDNRDYFEKFGKFSFSATSRGVNPDDGHVVGVTNLESIYVYDDHKFVTGYLNYMEDNEGVLDKREMYLVDGINYVFYDREEDSYKEDINDGDATVGALIDMGELFSKEAFNYAYGIQVKKTSKSSGYSLSLKNGLAGVMYFSSKIGLSVGKDFAYYEAELKARYTQDLIDSCYVSVTVDFDANNNLTNIRFEMLGLYLRPGEKAQVSYTAEIKPTDSEITQPQWVTDYLVSKN